MALSARRLLGLHVTTKDQSELIGTVETVLINPKAFTFEGLLLGQAHSEDENQRFLPRECLIEHDDHGIKAYDHLLEKPAGMRRILGLQAWTLQPSLPVGFVYDVHFLEETGKIESFTVHQLIRTWRIPTSAVVKITPNALLIDNDTTIKLKIEPMTKPA